MSARRRQPTDDSTLQFLPARGGDLLLRGLVRRSRRGGTRVLNRRRLYALLFFLWVGFTFLLTSIPLPDLSVPGPFADKVEHFAFYTVTGFLAAMWRRETASPAAQAVLVGAFLAALVGAADEFHQAWIPGRFADPADWLADAAGAVLGALAAGLLPLLIPSLRTE